MRRQTPVSVNTLGRFVAVLVVLILLVVVSGCQVTETPERTNTFSDSGSFSSSAVPKKNGGLMNCDGYIISIKEGTILRPGEWDGPKMNVNGSRIENGIVYTGLGGAPPGRVRLAVGESYTFPDVGKFTLRDVDFSQVQPDQPGGGPTAIFCFEPDPNLKLNPDWFPPKNSRSS